MIHHFDIAIIGAGPSGAVAATLLARRGYHVCVLEKQHFPRFVIGESLLPHAIQILEEAGMADAVQNGIGFQYKNGTAFSWGERYASFNFNEKTAAGPSHAFHVQRDRFDQILIDTAIKAGAEVRFGETVSAFNNGGDSAKLGVEDESGTKYVIDTHFVLDASGYYRALPRLLGWDMPSTLPPRQVHFTHIDDHITDPDFDRNKTLVCVHPEHRDVWLWLTCFSNGRSSIGVVGSGDHFAGISGSETVIEQFAKEMPLPARILENAVWDNGFPALYLRGYSASVKALYGRHFALLGNAAEFLDPVFSSGVTTAVHSANLAADIIDRHFQGEKVDWQREFADALNLGVNAFRHYVTGWYDQSFQNIVFSEALHGEARRQLTSIFAGYAWDADNPFVTKAERNLQLLAQNVGKPG